MINRISDLDASLVGDGKWSLPQILVYRSIGKAYLPLTFIFFHFDFIILFSNLITIKFRDKIRDIGCSPAEMQTIISHSPLHFFRFDALHISIQPLEIVGSYGGVIILHGYDSSRILSSKIKTSLLDGYIQRKVAISNGDGACTWILWLVILFKRKLQGIFLTFRRSVCLWYIIHGLWLTIGYPSIISLDTI